MNKQFYFAGAAAQTAARRGLLGWRTLKLFLAGLVVCVQAVFCPVATAQTTVDIAQTPLLALKTAPGLVMLTMSRDHRLFYAAYNDTSDVDGDGVVDVGFKPSITYYGNFVSDRCYIYSGSAGEFRPRALAASSGCKSGATQRWHGNWLNWATTSRMDVLRRVLYGGYRAVDNATDTGGTFPTSAILQGAFIPKDSHVWGKEFRPGRDTYDITQYTMLSTPASGKQHLFVVVKDGGNTTYPFMSSSTAPVLRYITDADMTTERIWTWASADIAQGIASSPANFVKGGGRTSVSTTDRTLRVQACVPIGGVREPGCTGYPLGSTSPTLWKPTGVLHDYSTNDTLKFGLITGSYQNNYSGGVLRRNIASFKSEIDLSTGQFSANDGIARTIDRLTIHGWDGGQYDCGYKTDGNRLEGACKSWGAPVAEMMYEGLRYFAGKPASTDAYSHDVGAGTSADSVMGFTAPPAWLNPYRAKVDGGSPICSRPVQMVIADPLTSFDSDQLPGAVFDPMGGFGNVLGTSDLMGLNVKTESDTIWAAEGLGSRKIFIGQVGALYDGNPTAKTADTFANIIGHAPDETQSRGGYYSAAVARFGRVTGVPIGAPTGYATVVPTALLPQPVDTISLVLGSLTPTIDLKDASGNKVSIVPLSKAVSNFGIDKAPGAYQATGAITGFYFASVTPTSVSAIVNFSDGDQGTDNETDAQVQYDVSLSGSTVTVKLTQLDPNPGGIQSNTGYVISGTSKDGLYLDTRSTTGQAGQIYYLDTLAGQDPKNAASPVNASLLPTYGDTPFSRSFTLSSSASGNGSYVPHDPLWYAAKYGGAGIIGAKLDPTNYFKVTNPSALPDQMGKAFRSAAALAAVASTSVVGAGQRSLGSAAIYQANYDSLTWSSRLYAFGVDSAGTVSDTPLWDASRLIAVPSGRTKLFLGRGGSLTPVSLASGSFTGLTAVEQADFGDAQIYEYLLGDSSKEERKGGIYRNRGLTSAADLVSIPPPAGSPPGTLPTITYSSVLGDIVNSDPQIISRKDYGYSLGDPYPAANPLSYASFLASLTTESIAVGTNNGFFEVFDAAPTASGGTELFGFMPQAARTNIKQLAAPGYQHRYFVDGAIGQGHANIPVPGDATAKWRNIAVAAGGAGAKTVFAVNTTTQTYSAQSVLWEINENSTLPLPGTLGNVMGRPAVGKLSNGTWVAIFGNGYNSSVGTATLFVVDLATGAILKEFETNSSLLANGLGSTEIVKISTGNMDTIEYVYGADYKGNIWRFDLRSTTVALWPATGALIFSTPSGRPITAEIKVGPATGDPAIVGKKMVYFGTGTYLNGNDTLITVPSQALYGIYDALVSTSNTTAAVLQSNLSVSSVSLATATSDARTTSGAVNHLHRHRWRLPGTWRVKRAGPCLFRAPTSRWESESLRRQCVTPWPAR